MKRKRQIKPYKISRGAFEEQKLREENRAETQRALLYILPLVMLAVLAVGIFFGYKFYAGSVGTGAVSPSDAGETETVSVSPMLYRAVNAASPLDESYVPVLTQSCGAEVSEDAADSLAALITAAGDDGFSITVVEGYISFKEQNERYQEAVEDYRKSSKASLVMAEAHIKRTIPSGGESEQQTGLLVYLSADTDGAFEDSAAYAWLVRHSVDYGFILRYPDKENVGGLVFSPHLFRYVGVQNAYRMRALDMNFDEYIAYLAAQ